MGSGGGRREADARQRRLLVIAWAVLVVAVAALVLHNYDTFQLGTYRDDARYVILARSLVFNDSYGLDYMPGPPRPTKYPFGFPLLLAPFVWLWPDQPNAGRAVSLIATLVNVSLLFWGWRFLSGRASMWWGPTIAALYGLAPIVIGHAHVIMSEAAFTTFLLATLMLSEQCARRPQRWSVAALGVALAATVCTRVVGLALMPVIVTRFALTVPWRTAATMVGAVLLTAFSVVTAVFLLTSVNASNLQPLRYVREVEQRWDAPPQVRRDGSPPRRSMARAPVQSVREVLVPIGGGRVEEALAKVAGVESMPIIISVGVTLVVLIGLWEAMRSSTLSWSVLAFEAVYIGALAVWSRPNPRLLYPLLPFLACQLLLGIGWLARRATNSPQTATAVVAAAWAVLVAASIYKSAATADSLLFVRDFRIGTEWLRTNSPADAIIMANEPAIMSLYAGRKTVDFPSLDSIEALARSLREQRIDYVLIGPVLEWAAGGERRYSETLNDVRSLLDALAQSKDVEVVYESKPDLVAVYRVVTDRSGQLHPLPSGEDEGESNAAIARGAA